jgi:hypothetical protein
MWLDSRAIVTRKRRCHQMEIPRKPIVERPFTLDGSICCGEIVLQRGRKIVRITRNVRVSSLVSE